MYKHSLMDENDGAGNDLPGDRGDNLESAADIAAREAKVAEDKAAADAKAADEAKEAEELAAKAVADEAEKVEKEERARDEKTGKFAKKDKEVPDHVPKARMDEAVNKERAGREAAERRAADLEAQVKKEERTDAVKEAEDAIEAMEKEHSRLILDGEDAKASAKMKEIRHAERKIASVENDTKLQAATSQAVEQVRMDATIARLAADHPQLRDGSEEFDEDLVNFVLSEQTRLMQTARMAPAAALSKAAENVMKKFQPAAAADPEGKKSLDNAKDVTDRKAEQVKKNLDTAAKQPASMRDTGKDSDKSGQSDADPDINKLSSEEIAALPKATLARMRGDFL